MKSIYELTLKEELKVMKELLKTPYGSQYFKIIVFSIVIEIMALLVSIILLLVQYIVCNEMNYVLLLIQFLIIFAILVFSLNFKTKWMDLVKNYYDEKKKK